MSQASIVINVSDEAHSHSNGLSGNWTVPAKRPEEKFGILVVYPTPEIQDIGDQRRTVHWLKASPLAKDICGQRSDSTAHVMGARGGKEKWGVLLCEAEPDVPRELLEAREAEIEFLARNRPIVEYERDYESKALVAVNRYKPGVAEKLEEMSLRIFELRENFEKSCRELVTKQEILRATKALKAEDARLIAEGDTIWAGPEAGRVNVSELHKRACRRLGQKRPWCYVAEQLIPCPGCGADIREDILSCPHCAGFLEEGIEELRAMKPKDRAVKMYPERYAEPITPGNAGRK